MMGPGISSGEEEPGPGDRKMSERAPQRSVELFKSGFFCAESVLLAIAESQGIRSDFIPPDRNRVLQRYFPFRRYVRSG